MPVNTILQRPFFFLDPKETLCFLHSYLIRQKVKNFNQVVSSFSFHKKCYIHTFQMQKMVLLWRTCKVSIAHTKAEFRFFKVISFQKMTESPF